VEAEAALAWGQRGYDKRGRHLEDARGSLDECSGERKRGTFRLDVADYAFKPEREIERRGCEVVVPLPGRPAPRRPGSVPKVKPEPASVDSSPLDWDLPEWLVVISHSPDPGLNIGRIGLPIERVRQQYLHAVAPVDGDLIC
jgi:hypothetical protein